MYSLKREYFQGGKEKKNSKRYVMKYPSVSFSRSTVTSLVCRLLEMVSVWMSMPISEATVAWWLRVRTGVQISTTY